MAIISPFAAIRYDARQVGGLDKVLTQPYDKITPEMQKKYFERNSYNLAYILKGEAGEQDSPTDNAYTRASEYFRKWREQGVLLQRERPALYAAVLLDLRTVLPEQDEALAEAICSLAAN